MAHVQPWLTYDGRPVPCLTAMPAAEFIATEGLVSYVDQFWLWLRGAAEDRLAAGAQGWEPSRREGVQNSVIVDRAALRALTADTKFAREGVAWLQTSFMLRPDGEDDVGQWFAEIGGPTKVESCFGVQDTGDGLFAGRGLALALWATSLFGPAPVFNQYEPDDVADFDGLVAKANRLGVGYKLSYDWKILRRMGWRHPRMTFPFFVIFLVRRPLPLLGEASAVEILPYVVPITFPGGGPAKASGAVKPVVARDRIEVGLLRRLSGSEELQTRWVALGAGSLGSKVSMHLARAGHPPAAIIDHAYLQPHQVARHGLYPSIRHSDIGWHGSKSNALAEAITRITRMPVGSIALSALAAQPQIDKLAQADPTPLALVNTTASLVVREGLCALGASAVRMIDAELHDQGSVGVLRVEGAGRNPNLSELAGAFTHLGFQEAELGGHLFQKGNSLSQVAIGEGCSSTTMVMGDASLSLQGAAIGNALEKRLAQLPDAGCVEVWMRRGGGLHHEVHEIGAFKRVGLDDGWILSISPGVEAAIAGNIQNYPKVETGGVLVGRVSAIAQSIQAHTLLPAPPDSVRRADYFELGVIGLIDSMRRLEAVSDGMLYVIGTWHSHLGDATPSQRDRDTAARLAAHTPYPLVLLVRGANGYHGIFAGPA